MLDTSHATEARCELKLVDRMKFEYCFWCKDHMAKITSMQSYWLAVSTIRMDRSVQKNAIKLEMRKPGF